MNFAGWLAHTFLHSKLTVLIMLALTLFGVMAVLLTPRTYNPDIVVPAANIIVMRPGSDAREIHEQVVKPLEALMASLSGVDHTYGYAVDDMGVVTVKFKVGQNEEQSLVKLYNQIMRHLDRIPPGTAQPLVKSISVNDVPILTINLSSKTLKTDALREVALRALEQLRNVPDVGLTQIIGGRPQAITVWIDPQKLAATGLALNQVQSMLKASNAVSPAGHLVTDNRDVPLRVTSALGNAREVGNIIIGAPHGRPVFLKDVARIEEGPAQTDTYASFAYGAANLRGERPGVPEPSVTLALAKRAGSNAVTVADAVLSKLDRLERQAIPQGVTVAVTRDYGTKANDAVNTLIEHLGISIAAVVLILMVFLGWREAAIVTLTVPLILFVVLGVGWIIGQTINRITLFALILSLGLLVDDSIVVIENIHRHLHQGGVRRFAATLVEATAEIGNPTNIATIAVILAFIPMAFVTGMMGPFMRPIPINVPVAMLASQLIAYIVVPWVAYRWLRGKALRELERNPSLDEQDEQPKDVLHRAYVRLIKPLIASRRRRNGFFAGVGVALLLALLQPAWQFIRPQGMNGPLSPLGVGLKMLPNDNTNSFLAEVDMPAGTALATTDRVAWAVGQVMARTRYVTHYETYVGRTAPEDFAALVRGDVLRRGTNLAQIRVNLLPKHERSESSHQIVRGVDRALDPVRREFPGARIKLFETPPGPPVRAQVLAQIYGPNYGTLRQVARYVRGDFKRVYGMINADDSVTATAPEYRIAVDRKKAALVGVTPAQVAQLVHDYVAGFTLGSAHVDRAGEPVDIIVRLPRPDRSSLWQILGLRISNAAGQQVPVGSLVRVERATLDKPIYDRDQHPVVYVSGDLLYSSPVYAVLSLNRMLDNATLPGGVRVTTGNLGFQASQPRDVARYQVFWGGEMRLTLDVFRDLGSAFIVALIFIYLLLVAYYQSFMLPLIVMGAIPLTLVGVFPGHWLTHQAFTATSMIGVIALAGIVVRNSLLLIDFILEYQRRGHPLERAVVEAGAARFRPILLTALAIILGSAIMISDPVFGGLAVSLIFGTFASTALTLLVIPLLYYVWRRRMDRRSPDAAERLESPESS
ncbi:MAG: efflux RND transporter permease subunit [Gammaproteobacteria bacterium]|nr:efflux RND transporter permease subunit [Gammaproteobacteria bacterium]